MCTQKNSGKVNVNNSNQNHSDTKSFPYSDELCFKTQAKPFLFKCKTGTVYCVITATGCHFEKENCCQPNITMQKFYTEFHYSTELSLLNTNNCVEKVSKFKIFSL